MPDVLPSNLRVAVYGEPAADPAWLARLRETVSRPVDVLDDASPARALAAFAARHPGDDVLLVRADTVLPAHWHARLARGWMTASADVLSALDNRTPVLSPLREGAAAIAADALDVDAWDAGAWCFGDRRFVATRAWSPLVSCWDGAALARIASSLRDGAPLPDDVAGAVLDHLFVADPRAPLSPPPADTPRDPRPADGLDTVRASIRPLAGAPRPALDGKPVLLHVLHGWGGGAERFMRDLAQADVARHHLVLGADGDFTRRQFGETITLRLPAHDATATLRRWPLGRAIAATALDHADYRAVLARVIADFGVDAMMVSSLIGHSLDALQTGLPTTIVVHDYYPLWPILHGDFGDATSRHDDAALAAALPRADAGFPFAERDARYWSALRDAYLAILRDTRPTLVAPIAGVRDNAIRIAPALRDLDWHLIPHGLAAFASPPRGGEAPHHRHPRASGDPVPYTADSREAPDTRHPGERRDPAPLTVVPGDAPPIRHPRAGGDPAPYPPPPRAKPRILVLGRIAGGKGEALLADLIPQARAFADFHLCGCGAEGERFFGVSGVHIELNYDRADLPAIIARIAPDVALLASTVAETFSYALSELWALHVPVVATRLGSFAERIEDGVSGWLSKPTAPDMLSTLQRVLADREGLARVRATLAARPVRDTIAMAADYAALAPPRADAASRAIVDPAPTDPDALARAAAERIALLATTSADARARTIADQQRELDARAAWVARIEREARERITALDTALRDAHDRHEIEVRQRDDAHDRVAQALVQLQGEFDERTQWALALDRRRAELEHEFYFPPNRAFLKVMRIVRRVVNAVMFRLRRAAGLARRTWLSLRTRGLGGTIRRTREFLAGGAAPNVTPPDTPALDAPFAPFAVPLADAPRVSIVIPVYNHFRHTFTCLRSLAEHPGTVPFEAIVVDDCSGDETPQRLPEIDGIVAVRNAENLGFIGACNAGAARARGEFVVFLNNDTAVRPGWLEALVDTFDTHPDCGLAGAKLVYPDGRLQEAGGIVFNDGSGWNFGRFDDPAHPQYNYVREADYCSGAAIMLRRELFERFDGFDVRYRPAYYEDTDIAFRVREAGLRVYYQPASEVVHFEGVTSGTDTGSGIKKHQAINQATFVDRWRDVLATHPAPGTPLSRARAHRARRQLLIADACTPTPDQDSGSVRMINLMRLLIGEGWQVAFCNENLSHDGRYTTALQQLGVEVLYRPHVGGIIDWLRERGPLLDAVLLSRHYIAAPLLPLVRQHAHHARVVFDTVDLHYLREERAAALEQRADLARAAAKTKAQELAVIRDSDVTLVVSPVERELLKHELPQSSIEVLSNVHEAVGARHGFDDRRDLFFVGGFQHPPNVDAVRWFVREIWPRVASALPDAIFHVIGSRITDEVRALAGDRVVVHGFVESLDPYLDGCRLSVAPLRYGAGVKGKVNQSMAHGQPVVATSMAVEGMHIVDGDDVLVADDPAAFADAVVRVYNDAALWQHLSRNGFNNVAKHFSFDAARAAVNRIFPR